MSTQSPLLDVVVERLRMGGSVLNIELATSITSAVLEESMETASSLVLGIRDPDRRLLRSGRLSEGVRAALRRTDGRGFDRYALVGVDKQGEQLELTFEDETVYRLRKRSGIKKATRGVVTRAEFAYSLTRELTHPTVAFYSPEIFDKQPIQWDEEVDRVTRTGGDPLDDAGRPYGFSREERVTVRGQFASQAQRDNIALVLKIGVQIKAPKLVLTAAVASFIIESSAMPPWGGTVNIERAARQFYLGPNTNNVGGGIAYYADTRTSSMAKIITFVRKNNSEAMQDRYRKSQDEAQRAVNLYLGNDRYDYRGSLKRVRTEKKAVYEFMRGDPNDPDKAENSWDCLTRLAEEVQWRCFVYRGTVYFISDEELASKRFIDEINEDDLGVLKLDHSYDVNNPVDEIKLTVSAERWSAPPGAVIKITGQGSYINNQRWLVAEFRRDLYSPVGEVTLRAPQMPLPEPAESIVSRQVNIETGAAADEDGTIRQRIVDIAKAQLARAGRDFNYRNSRPIPTQLRQSPVNTDCSGFVKMVYREAGAPDPNGTNYDGAAFTGTEFDHGMAVSKPKPGDLVFYDPVHAFQGHVAIVINETEAIGHGSQGGPRRHSINYRAVAGYRTYNID